MCDRGCHIDVGNVSVGRCVKYHGSVDASVVEKVKSVCLHFFWLRVTEIV